MTATFVAIGKMACAVVKLESSIAKFGFAEAFVRFAIVLGDFAEIRINTFFSGLAIFLTILTFGSAVLHIWSARLGFESSISGFGSARLGFWSWISRFWSTRSKFRVGSLDIWSLGLWFGSLRSGIWSVLLNIWSVELGF